MPVRLLDHEPAAQDEEAEILEGLNRSPKEISPKFFYDEVGSGLFEQICEQPEYYPTLTEIGIMREHVRDIAELISPNASLIEFGSGASTKTRLLLEAVPELAAYVPVDISREHLLSAANALAEEFPNIEILPVCADFTKPFGLPTPRRTPDRNVVYFPGSTIGNFSHEQAIDLLRVMRAQAKDDGALLIGVDLVKPREILDRAYNDSAGITANFNLNLLARMNREHGATFDTGDFEHLAFYDDEHSRIEMRLISLEKQTVHVAGQPIAFERDEFIVTEHSHKYTLEGFAAMAAEVGFSQQECWTDADQLFSVQYLTAV